VTTTRSLHATPVESLPGTNMSDRAAPSATYEKYAVMLSSERRCESRASRSKSVSDGGGAADVAASGVGRSSAPTTRIVGETTARMATYLGLWVAVRSRRKNISLQQGNGQRAEDIGGHEEA